MEKSLILTRAKSASIAHDFTTAARLYKELLSDDQSNVEYLKQLGSIYVQAGEDEKAIPYYQQIITFYPHYVEAMNSLGAIYRRLKRYEESIEILQRALDEDRQLPTVNYNLGFTYKEMGNYKDAIDSFEKVIHSNPDDVLAYNHLGSIYFAQKDYQKSIASYKRGLQIDHNHPILNYNLAHCYEASNNVADAIRCYKLALKTRPGWKDAIKDYTVLLMSVSDNKEAADIIKQGIKLYPNNTEMLILLGDIYLNNYDYSEAEKIFKKASSLEPENVKSLIGLSKALEKSDKSEYALDAIMSALELEPENQVAQKQYAQSLLSEKDYDEAKNVIDSLDKPENSKDLQLLDLNGQYYICKDNEEKAKVYYDKIKHINHHYKDYMINAANRFAQRGKYEKAEIYASEYLVHRPESVDGYNTMGKINYLKEDYDKAMEYYKKGLKLGKNNAQAEKWIKTISDQVNREKLFAEKVEEIEEEAAKEESLKEAQNSNENNDVETDDFDFSVIGSTSPLQEGLTKEEDDIWNVGDEDEEPVEENSPEEEKKESEDKKLPQENEPKMVELANDEELADFFDDKKNDDLDQSLESPAENKEVEEKEEEKEIEPEYVEAIPSERKNADDTLAEGLSQEEEEDPFDLFGDPVPSRESEEYEEEIEEPVRKTEKYEKPSRIEKEDRPDFDSLPDMNQLHNYAREAAETMMSAQKMANQMTRQQEVLQRQTEEALRNAMENIQNMQAQKMLEQDRKLESLMDSPEEMYVEPKKEEVLSQDDFALEEKTSDMDALLTEDFVKERPAEEEVVAVEENPQEESEFPEEEKNDNLKEKVTSLTTQDMLKTIERILSDDDAASSNADKIEMFKKLRLLCDYLPETEKDTFQSCRNRMLIDYIISKLSGKPGLLITAQSLIKSGILGEAYDSQLEKKCDDEMNNELIRKVIKIMKSMACQLEDKALSEAMKASADNILERIELVDLKSQIFQ